MDFSPTYISALAIILATIFAFFKINITKDDLIPLITSAVSLIAGIIILVRRYKKGDITIIGSRK